MNPSDLWTPGTTVTVSAVLAGVITLLFVIVRMVGRRTDPELLKLNGRLLDQMDKSDARMKELAAAIRLNTEVNNQIITELKNHEAQTKLHTDALHAKLDMQGTATINVLKALVKQIATLSTQHEAEVQAITKTVQQTNTAIGKVAQVMTDQNSKQHDDLAHIQTTLERIESMLIEMKPVLEGLNVRMAKAEHEVAAVKTTLERHTVPPSETDPPTLPVPEPPPVITKSQAKQQTDTLAPESEDKKEDNEHGFSK